MKRIFFHIIILLALTATTTGCSCNDRTKAPDGHTIDTEAFAAGKAAAQTIIDASSSESVMNDSLLEIRTHIHTIAVERGESAASDFEAGFETYLRENCDSLAKILL